MHTIITLDYELYFGNKTGTVSRAIVQATNRLLKVLDKYGIKAVFFVDVGFIKRLAFYKDNNAELEQDYTLICNQISSLSKAGHDIQLHIHPHWEDSHYENGQWNINAHRYRLADWPEDEIERIVTQYKNLLENFTHGNDVFAYRAGGWCIQPFDKIKCALLANNIWLDSTVFAGGYNSNEFKYFDFRNAPDSSIWRFESDPLIREKAGAFLEIPISSFRVFPFFFWRLAEKKMRKQDKHKTFGDGHPLPSSKKWLIKKLMLPSYSTVSIDGYKASLLNDAFDKKKSRGDNYFVVIGHPKALTPFSLTKLDNFIADRIETDSFMTFSDLYQEGIIEQKEQ